MIVIPQLYPCNTPTLPSDGIFTLIIMHHKVVVGFSKLGGKLEAADGQIVPAVIWPMF